MTNAITRSAQDLTIAEKRLICACLAKSNRDIFPPGYNEATPAEHAQMWHEWYSSETFLNGVGPFTVVLTATQYAEAFNVGMSTAYTQLQAAASQLMTRVIKRPTTGALKVAGTREMHWVANVEYFPGASYVTLTWSADFAQQVYCLGRERTEYLLKQASKFKSVYAWRLFELLRAHNDPRRPYSPTMEEFATAMVVPPAYVDDFGAMRRRVLDKAINELAMAYGYKVSYEKKTVGRLVVSLVFTYDLDPHQESLDLLE